MKALQLIAIAVAAVLALMSFAHGDETNAATSGSESGKDKVLGTEVVRTTDAQGRVVEKHIVKKFRARTVIDFEEASIEGKVKKPNAAYLLHGADLDFKHLYRTKHNQRGRIMSSYEYVR